MAPPDVKSRPGDVRFAVVAATSLLALGLAGFVQIFLWGADPRWAFVVGPPVAFFVALSWIAFKTDSATDEVTK